MGVTGQPRAPVQGPESPGLLPGPWLAPPRPATTLQGSRGDTVSIGTLDMPHKVAQGRKSGAVSPPPPRQMGPTALLSWNPLQGGEAPCRSGTGVRHDASEKPVAGPGRTPSSSLGPSQAPSPVRGNIRDLVLKILTK